MSDTLNDTSDFEVLLQQRLAETQARAADLATQIAALAGLRDANNDDEHDPDGSPVSTEWSRLAGMQLETAAEISAIRAALGRLERGTYGICASCGRPISPARLRIRPMVDRCVDCAD